ncbi:MAG TPA: mobilization protein [Porphyromonadaceae bacterium]|jgi:FtsZ-binding cell division protein ZapB|nr:mobilization protein [Porphyromonadaceae bacterium]
MGYAVLHLEKTSGTDSAMSAHIERTIAPKNADPERTYLNRELIKFPEGVSNRTQAIQHRLENAGLQRKISKNQIRAIRILLTGSNEDMKRIEADGKLDEWCNDNLRWLGETYGKENIVSAVLHLDESTPHIHATLVPIVTTERRKKKSEEQVKKQYCKKNPNAPRLSADDVMTRSKLKKYQDTYALTMSKFGLQRGIDGSEARHISTSQYYRELFAKNENLKENIDNLLEKQKNTEKELSKVKSEVSKEKFKNAKAEMGANLMDGVNSLFGGSKVKQQQAEIEELQSENNSLKEENRSLKTELQTAQKEHEKITDKLRAELKKIYSLFPKLRELLSIERMCRLVGFSEDLTKRILTGNKVGFKGSLYSAEYKRKFSTEHSSAQIEPEPGKPNKLRLAIDGVDIIEWFRMKYREFQRSIGIDWAERNVGRGRKM